MKVDKLKEMIRNLIEEIEDEEEMDEATTTGAVDGYKTPHAFSSKDGEKKKNKRMADIVGYTQVNEDKSWKRFLDPYNWFKSKDIFQNRFKNVPSSVVQQLIKLTKKNGDDVEVVGKNVWGFSDKSGKDNQALWQFLSGHLYYTNPNHKSTYDTLIPKLVNSKNEVNEATNRFQQLRKEEATPNQKIGKGIREMRTQIQEIEKFIEWYSKIKTENGLDSSQYWKRTQKHLNVIRERLNKISQKIQNLSV